MEITIITYGCVHDTILHILLSNELNHKNIIIDEYCNGEILKLKHNNKYTGTNKINIVYPTSEKNELKKLVGRSNLIYCDKFIHLEDRNIMHEHFGYMFKDEDYTQMQLFNIDTLTKENIVLPTVTKETYDLMQHFTLYVEYTYQHASRKFSPYHKQQRMAMRALYY